MKTNGFVRCKFYDDRNELFRDAVEISGGDRDNRLKDICTHVFISIKPRTIAHFICKILCNTTLHLEHIAQLHLEHIAQYNTSSAIHCTMAHFMELHCTIDKILHLQQIGQYNTSSATHCTMAHFM